MHMLTAMVTTNRLNAIKFVMPSVSPLIPREGMRKHMLVHTMVVPVSFDSWSLALGMYVVRSTGSFEAIASSVNVVEFNANHLQGTYLVLCLTLEIISQSMSRKHTNEAPATYKPIKGIGEEE
ncbi:hypothetical protein Sjap_004632 [Stephania japonica]|uniref:Uncharacterized protein n=1 Tax=Stephania japonica TaxID=461633 RepID=A0AAP0PJ96_9MAGN